MQAHFAAPRGEPAKWACIVYILVVDSRQQRPHSVDSRHYATRFTT